MLCEAGSIMVFTHDVSEPKLPGRGLNGVCVCVCVSSGGGEYKEYNKQY